MVYSVTITSQGQITIPAKIRKNLLKNKKKITLIEKDGEIAIKPETDIMDVAGIFHGSAIKNKSIDEIIDLEKKGIEEARMEQYIRKLKRETTKIVKI